MKTKKLFFIIIVIFFANLFSSHKNAIFSDEDYVNIAQYLQGIGHHYEAIELCKKAITYNPCNIDANLVLVKKYFGEKSYDNYISCLQNLLSALPGNKHLLLRLG